MPTVTPINGWYLPLLGDAEPLVEDINEWAFDADIYAFPRVATTAARDAIFPSGLPPGSVIYCEDTGEFYHDIGPGGTDHLSWIPRKFVLTEDVAVPEDHPDSPQTLFTVDLEANSFYRVTGYIDFAVGAANEGLVLGWTFTSPFDDEEISGMIISYDDPELWSIEYAEITATGTERRLESIKYCRIPTINATTATLNVWKINDTGADATVFALGTYIEVWKTGGG